MTPRTAPAPRRLLASAFILITILALSACERAGTEPPSRFTPVPIGQTAVAPQPSASVPAGVATSAAALTPAGTRAAGTPPATGGPTSAATRAVPGGTPAAAVTPSPTRVLPAATATTAPATATPTRAISGPTMSVKVYMIAVGDAGKSGPKVGCDDSVVAVDRTVAQSTGLLTAAEKELVSIKDKNIGQSGLYNALWQSNLAVDSVVLNGSVATVRLTGSTKLGGTCDAPRVIAQIKYTAMQNPAVKSVTILLNNVDIEKALSQQ